MKYSDLMWAALGVLAIALGGVELAQGKLMLGLSGLGVGAVLIATAAPALLKRK